MYNYYYMKQNLECSSCNFDELNDMIVYRFDKQGNIVKTINVLIFGQLKNQTRS